MVKGIDQFKAHFAGFADQYVLIGGAACYLAMQEAGLEFRVTKDLDIVLCVEVLDAEFVGAFWEFVKKGRYKNRQKSYFTVFMNLKTKLFRGCWNCFPASRMH